MLKYSHLHSQNIFMKIDDERFHNMKVESFAESSTKNTNYFRKALDATTNSKLLPINTQYINNMFEYVEYPTICWII